MAPNEAHGKTRSKAGEKPTGPVQADRSSTVLKGALDLCVLAVLAEGPIYGYGLIERFAERGLHLVAEGSVYPLLTRLEKRNLVVSASVPSADGPPRKYYHLTPDGRDALAVGTSQWREAVGQVGQVLGIDD